MAYTRKVDLNAYNQTFPSRLRFLLEENKTNHKTLAEYVGVTPQAIGAYTRGETIPKLSDAQKIADFFNISLDYLSGRNSCKTLVNQDIKNKIGLSDNAISVLMTCCRIAQNKLSDEDKETINRLIQKIQKNDISSESLWLTEAVTLDDLAIEQFQNIIDFINALLVNDNNGPDLCGLSDMANAYFMYIFEYKKLQMSNNKVMPHARDNLDISLFLCQRRFSEFIVSQAKKLMGGINNVNRTEEG